MDKRKNQRNRVAEDVVFRDVFFLTFSLLLIKSRMSDSLWKS